MFDPPSTIRLSSKPRVRQPEVPLESKNNKTDSFLSISKPFNVTSKSTMNMESYPKPEPRAQRLKAKKVDNERTAMKARGKKPVDFVKIHKKGFGDDRNRDFFRHFFRIFLKNKAFPSEQDFFSALKAAFATKIEAVQTFPISRLEDVNIQKSRQKTPEKPLISNTKLDFPLAFNQFLVEKHKLDLRLFEQVLGVIKTFIPVVQIPKNSEFQLANIEKPEKTAKLFREDVFLENLFSRLRVRGAPIDSSLVSQLEQLVESRKKAMDTINIEIKSLGRNSENQEIGLKSVEKKKIFLADIESSKRVITDFESRNGSKSDERTKVIGKLMKNGVLRNNNVVEESSFNETFEGRKANFFWKMPVREGRVFEALLREKMRAHKKILREIMKKREIFKESDGEKEYFDRDSDFSGDVSSVVESDSDDKKSGDIEENPENPKKSENNNKMTMEGVQKDKGPEAALDFNAILEKAFQKQEKARKKREERKKMKALQEIDQKNQENEVVSANIQENEIKNESNMKVPLISHDNDVLHKNKKNSVNEKPGRNRETIQIDDENLETPQFEKIRNPKGEILIRKSYLNGQARRPDEKNSHLETNFSDNPKGSKELSMRDYNDGPSRQSLLTENEYLKTSEFSKRDNLNKNLRESQNIFLKETEEGQKSANNGTKFEGKTHKKLEQPNLMTPIIRDPTKKTSFVSDSKISLNEFTHSFAETNVLDFKESSNNTHPDYLQSQNLEYQLQPREHHSKTQNLKPRVSAMKDHIKLPKRSSHQPTMESNKNNHQDNFKPSRFKDGSQDYPFKIPEFPPNLETRNLELSRFQENKNLELSTNGNIYTENTEEKFALKSMLDNKKNAPTIAVYRASALQELSSPPQKQKHRPSKMAGSTISNVSQKGKKRKISKQPQIAPGNSERGSEDQIPVTESLLKGSGFSEIQKLDSSEQMSIDLDGALENVNSIPKASRFREGLLKPSTSLMDRTPKKSILPEDPEFDGLPHLTEELISLNNNQTSGVSLQKLPEKTNITVRIAKNNSKSGQWFNNNAIGNEKAQNNKINDPALNPEEADEEAKYANIEFDEDPDLQIDTNPLFPLKRGPEIEDPVTKSMNGEKAHMSELIRKKLEGLEKSERKPTEGDSSLIGERPNRPTLMMKSSFELTPGTKKPVEKGDKKSILLEPLTESVSSSVVYNEKNNKSIEKSTLDIASAKLTEEKNKSPRKKEQESAILKKRLNVLGFDGDEEGENFEEFVGIRGLKEKIEGNLSEMKNDIDGDAKYTMFICNFFSHDFNKLFVRQTAAGTNESALGSTRVKHRGKYLD